MDGMSDMVFTVASPERLAMSNPFDDDCLSMDVDKKINVTQLADELGQLIGSRVMIAQTGSMLHVSPVMDTTMIIEGIRDHVADDLYGLDALQRKRQELMEKLSAGAELTGEEMRDALMIVLVT